VTKALKLVEHGNSFHLAGHVVYQGRAGWWDEARPLLAAFFSEHLVVWAVAYHYASGQGRRRVRVIKRRKNFCLHESARVVEYIWQERTNTSMSCREECNDCRYRAEHDRDMR
jgi:hypothetical protein